MKQFVLLLWLSTLSLPVFAADIDAARKAEELRRMQSVPQTVRPVLRQEPVVFPTTPQCVDAPRKTCVTAVPCPPNEKGDFFHFSEPSICLKVNGTISEFYAPTPASDAVRMVERDLAMLQIPQTWLQDATFDGAIKVNVDTYYFTGNYNTTVSGKLALGEGHSAGLWQSISGPFPHYLRDHGLNDRSPVHTLIEGTPDGNYRYTLYSPLGAPIVKTVTAKDAYYLDADMLAAIKKYGSVDGYTDLGRYSFYCVSDFKPPVDAPRTYNTCHGLINFSSYVQYQFDFLFGQPIDAYDAMKWFKDVFARIRPVFLNGMNANVGIPDPKSTSAYVENF